MFRRTVDDLPVEQSFIPTLSANGLCLNSAGQIVKDDAAADDPDRFFDFYHTNDGRTNELREEAVHQSVRNIVFDELKAIDLQQLYLSEDTVHLWRPGQTTPTINILATERSELKVADDVIIVVGEHTQDLGIWSWRLTMRQSGLRGGTALSLADVSYPAKEDVTAVQNAESPATPVEPGLMGNISPGVIILNPGELIWCNRMNKNVSQTRYLAQPKAPFYQPDYKVDPVHNRVKGHGDPQEHVTTFLDIFLQQLTKRSSRLYFVAAGDGSEAVMKWLHDIFAKDPYNGIKERIKAIALLQPTFQADQVRCKSFRHFCAHSMKVTAWHLSAQPPGKLLWMPQAVKLSKNDTIAKGMLNLAVDCPGVTDIPDSNNISASLRAMLKATRAFDLTDTSLPPETEFVDGYLCPGFSAGPEIDLVELMLPNLMPALLQWFLYASMNVYEDPQEYIERVEHDNQATAATSSEF